MQFNEDPIDILRSSRDQIALEFFSTEPVANFLKKMIPGIVNSFKSISASSSVPDEMVLNKDQSKFLKIVKDIPFSELGEIRAYVPEGMGSKYINYLQDLVIVTTALKNIQIDVLSPYSFFLAQLVSDTGATVSTHDKTIEYKKMEKDRDFFLSTMSAHFHRDSHTSETIVKRVTDRNNDWVTIFKLLNQCEENLKMVNRELMSRTIKQCVDYLDIITDQLNKDKMQKTSTEVAQRLSNGAYQVAKQLEFFGTTYFRVLSLSGSIQNTVNKVKEVMD